MFYDIRTLIQADTIVWLLSSCILLFVRKIRKTYPGFGFWVLQSAGITLGLQLQTLHGYAPPFVSILIGNGFFLAGALSGLIGIRVFLGRGGRSRGFWMAAAAVECALAWFTYFSPDLNPRVLLVSLFAGSVCVAIAIGLFLNAPPRFAPRRVLRERSSADAACFSFSADSPHRFGCGFTRSIPRTRSKKSAFSVRWR